MATIATTIDIEKRKLRSPLENRHLSWDPKPVVNCTSSRAPRISMIFTLVAVIVTLLFLWRNWAYSYWKRRNVPHPEPTTFPVGNLGGILSMKKHAGVILMDWYRQFKNYPWIGYYKVTSPGIVVRDLDLIKDILIKDFASFQANDVDFNNDAILCKNPFVCVGEEWKTNRAMLSPLFTLNKCKQLFPLMQPAINRMKNHLDRMGNAAVYDAKKFSSQFTTENVVKCGYSMDAGCFENPKNDFRQMAKKIFQPSLAAGLKFIIHTFVPFITRTLKVRFMPAEVSDWLEALLKDNVSQRKRSPLPQEDLLQWLLNGMEREKLQEDEVISHAFSFFIEGIETSSGVMTTCSYALARHPEVQQKLREEIRQVVLERHQGDFSFDALQEMPYLECVVLETLRMYPPGLTMAKRCTKPYAMPLLPGQKEPYICQPGTTVMIPVYALHMDREIYPDPEVFIPERFTEEERKNRHKAAYLPMGEGPRMCLGMKFAHTQIKLAIGHLVMDYKVTLESPNDGIQIDPAALMYQSKENIMIKFEAIKG